ncbi:hypothetical protein MKZ38_007179 [Zalerion maritima]|uniref:Uncharacterized protein n=1 Tax=Zalerion maritima TaxID=339359 RepID=A0AAD5WN34_9PEZI|nr:hypothetical protein MKZ38_007179 [Zalerion maritima]
MQILGYQPPPKADLCRATPPTSPPVDQKPMSKTGLTPGLTEVPVAESSSRVASSNTDNTYTNSNESRYSVTVVQSLLDKIRIKLLPRRQIPIDEEEEKDIARGKPPPEARYYINDRDVRAIIEFVLSQTGESSAPSSRISAECSTAASRVSPGTMGDIVTPPSSTFSSPCSPDGGDVVRRLRELTTPMIPLAGSSSAKPQLATNQPPIAASSRVMSPTVPEPILEIDQPYTDQGNGKAPVRPSDSDIWNLCLARPVATTPSCRTKPAPPTLRTSPVRAATTLQAVQDHAFGSWADRRNSVVSRSDLSVYSCGGESSTGGFTSFPKLRRRRSSDWLTPLELMDRQYHRPEDEK